jgi:DNA-binding protein H-NS
MGLADRLKGLRKKAEDTAVEHRDQIHDAVQKAEVAADQRTEGRYHEQIQKAGAKADALVEGLQGTDSPATTETTTDGTAHASANEESAPPAS